MSKRHMPGFNDLAPAVRSAITNASDRVGMSTDTILNVLRDVYRNAVEDHRLCLTTLREAFGEARLVTIKLHVQGDLNPQEAERRLGF